MRRGCGAASRGRSPPGPEPFCPGIAGAELFAFRRPGGSGFCRRHRAELARIFADGLGYRLVVEPAAARPGLPLAGVPAEPAWDAELGAAMRHHAVAVHEEAVLGELLTALT